MSHAQKLQQIRALLNISEQEATTLLEQHSWDVTQALASRQQPQTYFAGGDRSGMLVEQPNNKPDSIIQQILKKAADGPTAEPDSNPASQKKVFRGTGYKLGSDEVPSEQLHQSSSSEEEETEVVHRHLTFWKEGFTIEDGELMRYDDPKNKSVLEQINSGTAPVSLFGVKPGQQADVHVIHRTQDSYVKPKAKAFSGQGNRLGAPTSSPQPAAQPAQTTSSHEMSVDESLPTTSIQIRLANGARLVARFNLSHTVQDIRSFIDHSGPQSPYVLQTQFPTKPLTDMKATIKDAGLTSAVIFQKLT